MKSVFNLFFLQHGLEGKIYFFLFLFRMSIHNISFLSLWSQLMPHLHFHLGADNLFFTLLSTFVLFYLWRENAFDMAMMMIFPKPKHARLPFDKLHRIIKEKCFFVLRSFSWEWQSYSKARDTSFSPFLWTTSRMSSHKISFPAIQSLTKSQFPGSHSPYQLPQISFDICLNSSPHPIGNNTSMSI